MNILIVGSGAREHAIAKALQRSKHQPKIFCYASSHNPGIAALTKNYHVGDINDVQAVLHIAEKWKIDFAIIGPEAPLEKGLSDLLWQHSIPAIGPKKNLAQIETSKSFTRHLMQKYQIPGSLQFHVFHNLIGAKAFLEKLGCGNYVIKADGLMGGKGVKVAGDHLHSLQEAYQFCQSLHEQGHTFVIEEKLVGQEFSLLAFCDGEQVIAMPVVQDHKRAFVKDQGPNTGGMGGYSDANHCLPFLSEEDVKEAKKINEAVIKALQTECHEKYMGILYGSFIATKDGIKVIEFNARFGDPEAMNVLAILESDFVEIARAMIDGNLSKNLVKFSHLATVCKYAVPEGYPDQPLKNFVVDVSAVHNKDQLYFAAVNFSEGKLLATGSRTVAYVGIGKTIAEAEQTAEAEINRVQGKLFHREDIGTRELINQRINQMRELRQKDYVLL